MTIMQMKRSEIDQLFLDAIREQLEARVEKHFAGMEISRDMAVYAYIEEANAFIDSVLKLVDANTVD